MAEPRLYNVIERTGTPIVNGDASHGDLPPWPAEPGGEPRVSVTVNPLPHSNQTVGWNDLYSPEFGKGAVLIRAHTLLVEGQGRLGKAIDCIRDEDTVGADYEITLFQGTIPELFCCNSLSEGFESVIVALRWALKNRQGAPLSIDQIHTVLNCTVRLSKELLLTYDGALDLIDALEAAGLNTDISVAAPIADLLIEEDDEPHQVE